MSSPFDLTAGLDADFSGIVRLFPLPNVVLFPHVLMPLHIFEPRYIAMTQEAIEEDGLIAMAHLKPGFETAGEKLPEIHPVICVGRIAHQAEVEGGRYNLVLQGVQRARIVEELPLVRPFRQAKVELLIEQPISNASTEDQRRAELLRGFRKLFPNLDVEQELHQVFESVIPLGTLCDVFGYALGLDPAEAQQLLTEHDVDRRSRLLSQFMSQALANRADQPDREFPPPFSLN